MRLLAALLLVMLAGCEEKQPAPAVRVEPPAAIEPTPTPVEAERPAPKPVPPRPIRIEAPLPASPAAPGVPREAMRYQRDLIGNARAVWGLNAPIATFAGQVHQESTWKADARSRTGAAGLAQFMPATAEWISGVYDDELGENDSLNPTWALRGLVRYDKHLFDRVKPADTDCDRMLFALSDYNGGSGWRMKRQKKSDQPGSFVVAGMINPGITAANQRENQEYPTRIVRRWQPLYRTWGIGVCE